MFFAAKQGNVTLAVSSGYVRPVTRDNKYGSRLARLQRPSAGNGNGDPQEFDTLAAHF